MPRDAIQPGSRSPMKDPTQRFSSRAENYRKYRPSYPRAVVGALRDDCGLISESAIADIGSGTGLLTELFLENGNAVYAVEPNPEMRAEGERFLRRYSRFRSVDGRAEASSLADRSVDFVVAGQSFHWFDRGLAQKEFARILRPAGWAMLAWNHSKPQPESFLQKYERLRVQYATDQALLNMEQRDADAAADLFGPRGFRSRTFSNPDRLDYPAVLGRLLSLSFTPEPGHPNHETMLAELAELFRAHEAQGTVEVSYMTTMYYGRVRRR